MKTVYALPLVLLSLFAVAAPASAEDLRFENAEQQLREMLYQFDFDIVELSENTSDCVTFRVEDEGFIFYVSYGRDNLYVCYATWSNDRGVRRDTLMQANDFNGTCWATRAILMSDERWKLFTAAPPEVVISTVTALDLLETFLADKETFIATF